MRWFHQRDDGHRYRLRIVCGMSADESQTKTAHNLEFKTQKRAEAAKQATLNIFAILEGMEEGREWASWELLDWVQSDLPQVDLTSAKHLFSVDIEEYLIPTEASLSGAESSGTGAERGLSIAEKEHD